MSVIERQVTRIRSLSTWSHTHTWPRDSLAPAAPPLTTEPVLSGTLWSEGQGQVRRRAVVRAAGGKRRPWGVTCHGTRAKAHAGTHPSAHPRRSQPLAQPVDTAGQPLGTAGLEFGTASVPTLCYQCKTSYFSVFEKNFRK